jgi:hypothetical protein
MKQMFVSGVDFYNAMNVKNVCGADLHGSEDYNTDAMRN